jgi:hypothetical protein
VVKINIKGYKCCNDEANVKVVLGEGEHRDADVAEDEILGQKVEELEKLLSSSPRIHREIIVRVVGLTHPTEKHSHNAWKGFLVFRKMHSQDRLKVTSKLGSLSHQKCAVRHQEKESRFQQWKVTDSSKLCQVNFS